MRLGAGVAFAFNSLAQGPITRKSCRRRESNPGPRDSRPDALATLPPRFAFVQSLVKITKIIKPRRDGFQIAAPGNWARRQFVCPRRMGSQTTNAVEMRCVFNEKRNKGNVGQDRSGRGRESKWVGRQMKKSVGR